MGGWDGVPTTGAGEGAIKVQREGKENILHKLLHTAVLSAAGSIPRSLCEKSKGSRYNGQLTLEHR